MGNGSATNLANFVLPEGLRAAAKAAEARKLQVVVAATFTAEPLLESLSFWMRELGLEAVIEFAGYNQVFQQLLDAESLFSRNRNGVNVVLVRLEDWLKSGGSGETLAVTRTKVERNIRELAEALREAAERNPSPHLVVVCPASPRVVGDVQLGELMQGTQGLLLKELEGAASIYCVSPAELSGMYPVSEYDDPEGGKLGHIPYTRAFFASVGTVIARKTFALKSPPYKVLALDCDQTLWRGVCAEDGATGVEVDGPRRWLQEFVVRQHEAGMLICLCSKNAEEDVVEVFSRNPAMTLKREHIVSWRINWEPKSENLKSLASELGVGLDSFVFMDDNPAECAEVRASCPDVLVLELPVEPSKIPKFLANIWAFDRLRVTEEDRARTRQYFLNAQREQVRRKSPSFEEFLRGLGLEIQISEMKPEQLPRVAQLTQRTNQFNMTTRRRTEGELRAALAGGLGCRVVEVADRFGNYGLVGVLLYGESGGAVNVDTFLLSCRVLGKGVEHRMLAELGRVATGRNLSRVAVRFVPTPKNKPAWKFLESVGSEFRSPQAEGSLFAFPAEYAAELKGHAAPVEGVAGEGNESPDGIVPSRVELGWQGRLETIGRIGAELGDVERVLARIDVFNRKTRPETREYVAPQTPQEMALESIWREVLGLERVGTHDNFFALGGDSLAAAQVMSRVNRNLGVKLGLGDMFEAPTIESLAALVGKQAVVAPENARGEGEAPLTAIQRWFFEKEFVEAQHWNQAVMLRLRQPIAPKVLEEALRAVYGKHDALRLRFEQKPGGWRQAYAEGGAVELTRVELGHLRGKAQEQAVAAEAARLQASLSLGAGPVQRAALFELGEGGRRLFWVIHHLVVDGVSWRVLLEDLQQACGQLLRGEKVELGPRSTSFGHWGERLVEYVRLGRVDGELEYWTKVVGEQVAPLPVELKLGPNTEASSGRVSASLGVEGTRQLLQEAGRAYRTQVQELLLAALARTLCRWTGGEVVGVEVEGHGREEVVEGVDLSRTVGWFTSIYPVRLRAVGQDVGEQVRATKEALRGVPRRGLGYGLLRYLHSDEAVRERLAQGGASPVVFNYLGQLDAVLAKDALFSLAEEPSGPTRSPLGLRTHALDVEARVVGGELRVDFGYSRNLHRRETIERLAGEYLAALREVVGHCVSPEAGGYTPSDFPLAKLDQGTIDGKLGRRGVESVYPLSPMQEGMLFHALLEPDSPVYFEQLSCIVREVEAGRWEEAWREVAARHAALRTSILWEGLESPLQVVHETAELRLERHVLKGGTAQAEKAQLEELLATDRKRGFVLSGAPPLRFLWVELSGGRACFVWDFHHLLMDGWSLAQVMKEVVAVYEVREAGRAPRLDPAGKYEDYIAWLSKQDRGRAEAFWREALKGFEAATPLVVRQTEAREAGLEVKTHELTLSESMTAALMQLAQRNGLTLNNVVVGAWALLLSRYSGERDVVFGVTMSGRPAELQGAESAVGLFINTVPLRVEVDETLSVVAWLKKVQAKQVELQPYEWAPLVDIQKWSEVGRGSPLFDTIFVFENFPVDVALLEKSRLQSEGIQVFEQTNYPLTVVVTPKERLQVRFAYRSRELDADAAGRMAQHLETLLKGIAERPEQRISSLPLMTEAEEKLLAKWNDTAVVYPEEKCVHELVEEQAARTPDAVAVTFEGKHLTYAELNARANQLGNYLRKLGVGPEVLVGVCLERSLEIVVGVLGVLKAGGAYVPLDPELPVERLRFMLGDTGAATVLTQQHLKGTLPSEGKRAVCLDSEWAVVAKEPTVAPETGVGPRNLAYVIYTSGSTGKPKGAMNEHGAVSNRVRWANGAYGMAEDEIILHKTPLFYDFSAVELFGTLIVGAKLVVARPQGHKDAQYLEDIIHETRVTAVHFVPSMLQVFLEQVHRERVGSLRRVYSGGEVLSEEVQRQFFERMRGIELYNQYGPTECAIGVTAWHCVSTNGRVVPIGRPIANARVHILDRELRSVPVGVAGELYIAGLPVGRGYWGKPELTKERFVKDPFTADPNARMYRTGDLARWRSDGAIECLGRTDFQVKLRGFRIELGEIEAVLLTQPGVSQVVVVLREERLVAYVVPGKNERLGTDTLASALKRQLPEHMVPSAFVFLEAMPLTPSGKLDRQALPPPEFRVVAEEYVEPRTETEKVLAGIWGEVLGLERVGVNDDFFRMGGQSLLAARAVSRLRQTLNKALPLKVIFESRTVERVARALDAIKERSSNIGVENIRRADRSAGRQRASLFEQRMFAFMRAGNFSLGWWQDVAYRIRSNVDIPSLQRAIEGVFERHEVLQSHYEVTDGILWKSRVDRPPLQLQIVEFASGSSEERYGQAVSRLIDERARVDGETTGSRTAYGDAPLFKAYLAVLGEKDFILAFGNHHLCGDGSSVGIIRRDVQRLYEARLARTRATLPELPYQYDDFGAWDRLQSSKDPYVQKKKYWQEKIQGIHPTVRYFIRGRDRKEGAPFLRSHCSGGVLFEVPEEVLKLLKLRERQRTGQTMFVAAFSSAAYAIARRTGATQVSMFCSRDMRRHAGMEHLVGYFSNPLLLSVAIPESGTVGALLREVEKEVLEVYDHDDIHLVPDVIPLPTDACRVLFNFQEVPDAEDGSLLELERIPMFAGAGVSGPYDLSFFFFSERSKLRCAFFGDDDICGQEVLEHLKDGFLFMLEKIGGGLENEYKLGSPEGPTHG